MKITRDELEKHIFEDELGEYVQIHVDKYRRLIESVIKMQETLEQIEDGAFEGKDCEIFAYNALLFVNGLDDF